MNRENEVEITGINSKSVRLSKLNEQINKLRGILDEVCCTLKASEVTSDILIISQQLDELIVEYMNELNNKK